MLTRFCKIVHKCSLIQRLANILVLSSLSRGLGNISVVSSLTQRLANISVVSSLIQRLANISVMSSLIQGLGNILLLSLIALAFLTLYSKGEIWEHCFIVLNGPSLHYLPKVYPKPLNDGCLHILDTQQWVPMMSHLKRFHSVPSFPVLTLC